MNPVPPDISARGRIAFKAANIVPLAGESAARGAGLLSPALKISNAWLVVENGRIAEISRTPPACPRCDLGNVALLPPLINCHAHLSLSWLAGKTVWQQGFAAWLKSMLPLLLPIVRAGFGPQQITALAAAWADLAETAHVGDVGGSIAGALTAVDACAQTHGPGITYFCEWFGFSDYAGIWPLRCEEEISPRMRCAPAAHALYSTAPEIMDKAHAFCLMSGRVFSFHLAESEEETGLLLRGAGPLYELYRNHVLPPRWRPPGLRPVAYARQLGLLAPGSLAVHCVQLNQEEIATLAASGAAVCLCPRSNYNLGVGEARVRELIDASALLCLGSDGLTSSQSLNVKADAFFLRERFGLPWPALWRMATVNGAFALRQPFHGLTPGVPARFSIWPEENDV